jgi:hypothetical protein
MRTWLVFAGNNVQNQIGWAGFMNIRILSSIVFIGVFVCTSCWGPKKTPEEENILKAFSNLQASLEAEASYEQYIKLLDQVEIETQNLKGRGKNNPCFLSAIDKCVTSYRTCAKAWEQKLLAKDENRKQDMDLTLSVMKSFAALNVQRAAHCFEK